MQKGKNRLSAGSSFNMIDNIIQSPVASAEIDKLTSEEMDQRISSTLFEWLDSGDRLDPVVREELVARSAQLRLKIQTIFLEIQKKIIKELYIDVEAETELRREMRLSIPYMDPGERAITLKAMVSSYDSRLERLERQLAGWDLMSNVEFALQSLSETRVPTTLTDKVRELTPAKRRNLLNIIDDLKLEIENTEKKQDVTDIPTG